VRLLSPLRYRLLTYNHSKPINPNHGASQSNPLTVGNLKRPQAFKNQDVAQHPRSTASLPKNTKNQSSQHGFLHPQDVLPTGTRNNHTKRNARDTISVPARLPPIPNLRRQEPQPKQQDQQPTRGRSTERKQNMSIFPKNFVDDYEETGFGLLGSQLGGSFTAPSASRRSSSRSSQKSSSSYDDSAVGAICCDVEDLASSALTNTLDEFLQDDDDAFAESADMFASSQLDMSDMLENQQYTQEQSQIGAAFMAQKQQQQQQAQAYNGQAEQSLEHDHMPAHLESLFGITANDLAVQQASASTPALPVNDPHAGAWAELLKQMTDASAAPILEANAQIPANPAVSAQSAWSDQFLAASILSTASSFFPEDQSPVCAPSSAWAKPEDEWMGPPANEAVTSDWAGPSMFASLSEVPALHAQQTNASNKLPTPRRAATHLDNSVLFPKAVAEPSSHQGNTSTVNPLIFAATPQSTPLQTVQSSFGTPRSTAAGVFKQPLPPVSASRMPSFDTTFAASVQPSPALSTFSDFSPAQNMEDTMGGGGICPSSGKVGKPATEAATPYIKMRKSRVKPGDPAEVRKYTAPSQTSRKTISSAIAKKHGIAIDALGNPVRPDGITDDEWEEMNPIRAQIQADIKREKNREAQRVSRQKRTEEMQGLQDMMMHWKQLAETLQAENDVLKKRNAQLEQSLGARGPF
jgi:hypothetical protein